MTHPTITIKIEPMGKPRMTQADKFYKRKVTSVYWNFKYKMKTLIKIDNPELITGVSWVAYFTIPKSRKKDNLEGKLHRQKPDRDNIDKAILDALFKDDSKIATGSLEKRLDDGKGARIELIFHSEQQ